jgi:protein-S-isoprenylcysteine O-methyltransferase Ste14
MAREQEPSESTAAERSQARAIRRAESRTMIPGRERRRSRIESAFMRLIATSGIVGIGVALGAILTSQDVAGWIIGLVISLVTVVLAAILWSSRRL